MDARLAMAVACCDGESWCAVTCTAQTLSRKWHTILVHHLLEDDGLGFAELERRVEGISGKVLSESLDDLVASGLAERVVVSETPRRVRYGLTAAGRDLAPVIEAMAAWGRKHMASGRRLPAAPI